VQPAANRQWRTRRSRQDRDDPLKHARNCQRRQGRSRERTAAVRHRPIPPARRPPPASPKALLVLTRDAVACRDREYPPPRWPCSDRPFRHQCRVPDDRVAPPHPRLAGYASGSVPRDFCLQMGKRLRSRRTVGTPITRRAPVTSWRGDDDSTAGPPYWGSSFRARHCCL
jgi:hypothetical protein